MPRGIPETLLHELRLIPGFNPELEQTYLEQKFQETRFLAVYVGIAASLLSVALLLWDWVIDPTDMLSALWLRILIGLILLLYPLTILTGMHRSLLPWVLAAVTLVSEALFLYHISRLDSGPVYGIAGFMYWFLLPVFMALPYRFTAILLLSVSIALLPNILVPLGVAPTFELDKYNALIWPTCVIAIFINLMVDQLYRRVFLYQMHAEDMARTDELTGLANRRSFMEQGEQVLELCRRNQHPLSVIMFDIDRFKSVNDDFGHHVGDKVLRQVAGILHQSVRKSDILGRHGGEEFALILPETRMDKAFHVADKIRHRIASTPIKIENGPTCRVTISAGVSGIDPVGGNVELDQLLQWADEVLYQAKGEGRNQVVSVSLTRDRKTPPGLLVPKKA